MERIYLNTKDSLFVNLSDFPQEKVYKLIGKFFYYKCDICGVVKSKRIYSKNRKLKVDFTCRECKFKRTFIDRYGENGFSLNMDKARKTMLEKYGTTNTSQFIDYSKIDYDTRNEYGRNTCIEKYGVDNPAKAQIVKDKIQKTNLEKYGVKVAACSDTAKNKARNTILSRYGSFDNLPGSSASHKKFLDYRKSILESLNLDWLDADSFHGKNDKHHNFEPIYYTFRCKKCENIFKDSFTGSGVPICRTCNPNLHGTSKQEDELYNYVKSIYNGQIERHNRKVLGGKELDIYFPKLNIAIEYNGHYWHGYRKDTDTPLNVFKKNLEEKRLICQSKGIRLVTVYEIDYLRKTDVFQRFFQDILCPRTNVSTTGCIVKDINTKTAKDFCNVYCIDGFKDGYRKLGLFHDNEFLMTAVFNRNSDFENECVCLAKKTNYNIPNGFAKISKYFGKKFVQYVDLRYFTGENKTELDCRVLKKKLLDIKKFKKIT